MRKLAIVVALASTALATPAFARNDAWYIGVEGGAMIVEDIKLDIGALNDAGTVDHDYGYDVDGIIGYDLGLSDWKLKLAFVKHGSMGTHARYRPALDLSRMLLARHPLLASC